MNRILTLKHSRMSGSNADLRVESPDPRGAIHQKRCSIAMIVTSTVYFIFAIVGCTQSESRASEGSGCTYYLSVLSALIMIAAGVFSTFTLYARPGKRLPAMIRYVFLIISSSLAGCVVLVLFTSFFRMFQRLRYLSYYYRRSRSGSDEEDSYSTPSWVYVTFVVLVVNLVSSTCYVVCGLLSSCISCYQQGGCCPQVGAAVIEKKEIPIQKFTPHDEAAP